MTQPDLTTNLTKPIAPPDRVRIYLRNLLAILKGKHHEQDNQRPSA